MDKQPNPYASDDYRQDRSIPTPPQPEALTAAEFVAIDLSVALISALRELPVLHPRDLEESVRDIHNLQNRIMARAAQRAYPDRFYLPITRNLT